MKGNNIRYAEAEDRAVYLSNGYYAVRIPEEWFWLDRSKLGHTSTLDKFFENLPDTANELTFRYHINDGKTIKSVLGCEKFDICLNTDFFKMLRLISCKMYAVNAKSEVYFTLNEKIYAVCMPLAQ